MTWAAWIAIALFAITPAYSSARAMPTMPDVNVSWGGVVRPDSWTELRLLVTSPEAGTLRVEARVGSVQVVRFESLVQDEIREFRMPVRLDFSDSGENLSILLRWQNGSELTRVVALRWIGANERIVAVAARLGAQFNTSDRGAWLLLPESATTFPNHAKALSAVDALVLDRQTLEKLSDLQLSALEQYLGECGRVVLINLPKTAIGRANSQAGCGAVLVREIADPSMLRESLAQLFALTPPNLPGVETLASMFPKPATKGFLLPLVAFFSSYVLGVGILPWLTDRFWILLLLPIALSTSFIAALLTRPPIVNQYVYIEATTGSRVARFVELTRIGASGRSEYRIHGKAAFGIPAANYSPGPSRYEVTSNARDPAGSSTTGIMETRLLSESLLRTTGVVYSDQSLQIFKGPDATPRIENHGGAPTAPSTLLWKGDAYAIPSIRPGATFEISDQTPLGKSRLPHWLAQRRALQDDPLVVTHSHPSALAERSLPNGEPREVWTVLRTEAQH